ncbi:MAG: Fe(2+)-trafficking protein [Myxococcales bacterium]|nr:Fe(2+)-trafficking protein [Myxococcales bacterium]
MPAADPNRNVMCIKLKKELPALAKPPFPNELGKYVHEHVSKDGWDQWLKESVRYINTYRVDLSSREGTEFMLKQLRIWLGLEDGDLAQTAWTPPSASEGATAAPTTSGDPAGEKH